MNSVSLTANNQRAILGRNPRGSILNAHCRSTSTMSAGTVRYQYAVVGSPVAATDAHWETIEGMSAVTAGQTRYINWPGTIAAQLVSAGAAPAVVVDYETANRAGPDDA